MITIFRTYLFIWRKRTCVGLLCPFGIFSREKNSPPPQIAIPTFRTVGFMLEQVPQYLRIPVCDELTIKINVLLTILHCYVIQPCCWGTLLIVKI